MTELKNILAANNVTFEQASKVTLVESNGTRFAICESQTEAGQEYRIEYVAKYNRLSCNCKAGAEGRGCWHKRATVAQIAIAKLETRAIVEECMNDASIPQTAEQAERAETEERVANAKGPQYSERQIKAAQRRNEIASRPFSLLK